MLAEEQGTEDKLLALSLLLLVVEEVVVVPAPADTTSELLLVEKVLALGLDCPPFAVLAFIPISSHECFEWFGYWTTTALSTPAPFLLLLFPEKLLLLLGYFREHTQSTQLDYKELPSAVCVSVLTHLLIAKTCVWLFSHQLNQKSHFLTAHIRDGAQYESTQQITR